MTERKQAEGRLAASERLFHQLADAMPQIVWAARSDGYSDYYNQRWIEYIGLRGDAAGKESWKAILHPDDVQNAADSWSEAIRTGHPLQTESRFKSHTTGEYRWHLVRALPIRGEANQIVRWIGTCTDIDDLKRAEQELRDRSHLAELAADIGSAFAAGGELSKTLQACAESLVGDLDAAFARIWSLNEAENVLELRASAGLYTHLDGPHGRVPVGQFKIGLLRGGTCRRSSFQAIGLLRAGCIAEMPCTGSLGTAIGQRRELSCSIAAGHKAWRSGKA